MKRRCPVCKKIIDMAVQRRSTESDYYPFCCRRCKLIDLGRWLDGDYKIIGKLQTEDAGEIGEEPANGADD